MLLKTEFQIKQTMIMFGKVDEHTIQTKEKKKKKQYESWINVETNISHKRGLQYMNPEQKMKSD